MAISVSIIVPVFQIEAYIGRCIESLINQTYSNFELLLIDDGSTDASGEICDNYAKKDHRIKVIHKSNGGLISAWKCGLNESQFDLVTFVDGDDWVAPNMLEVFIHSYQQYHADVTICSFIYDSIVKQLFVDNKIPAGFYDKNRIREEIFPSLISDGSYFGRGIFLNRCGKLINKQILLNNIWQIDENVTMGEDVSIIFPTVAMAERIVILEKQYLYHYFCNTLSMTHEYNPKMYEKIILLYQTLDSICIDLKEIYDFSSQLKNDYCDQFINIFCTEYSAYGSFSNYKAMQQPEQAKHLQKLKQYMDIKRYRNKAHIIFALLIKANFIFKSFILGFLKLYKKNK
ncbi:MAG: glycosyltransferase family 2 protein [Clostridia bacterium]|nr:glycosyltransferase family 2 protein [Clostridia bacterium]